MRQKDKGCKVVQHLVPNDFSNSMDGWAPLTKKTLDCVMVNEGTIKILITGISHTIIVLLHYVRVLLLDAAY